MTLAEEILDEMKCGRNAMFVVGLASLAEQSPYKVMAALRSALQAYHKSNYHELGPAAMAASRVQDLRKGA